MNKDFRGQLAIIVIVSLLVGSFAGTCGSFFLKPYLESTSWGQKFLQSDITERLTGQKKVYEVTEESATIDVVKKVSPSVVSIVVTKELKNIYNLTGPDIFNLFNLEQENLDGEQEVGGGTGFVIDGKGLILTNKHVVEDLEAKYSVVFNDGKTYEAEVLGRDVINDIAILKVSAEDLPVLELGDSDKIEIGQTVVAIGNALGEYRNTVTRGVISGINRRVVAGDGFGGSEVIEEAIQTDTAINPGNSGGPLLNLDGQVVGINTAVNWQGQSLSFAIPINQAKNVIDGVRLYGKIVRPWLGVRYIQLNERIAETNGLEYDFGALILRGDAAEEVAVVPGSPADKAGLVENDIVLEINGQKLDQDHSLINEVAKFKPGEEIELKVFHKDAEKTVKILLEERKE